MSLGPEVTLNSFELQRNLRAHTNIIRQVIWSPDGKMLASCSDDNTIKLWNVEFSAVQQTLMGHADTVTKIAWSSDGKKLISCSKDNTVKIWDVENGKLKFTLSNDIGKINSIIWSPDNTTVACGGEDTLIRLWDSSTGKLREILEGHTGAINGMLWSSKRKALISCSEDATIRIWNTTNGMLRKTLVGHTASVLSLTWYPDERVLASGSEDKTICLWDAETGMKTGILEDPKRKRRPRMQTGILEGHTNYVNSVSFSYDGRLLASGSYDGTIRIWRCDTWDTVSILNRNVFFDRNFGTSLAFHPNSPTLATLGEEANVIQIWDLDLDALLKAAPVNPSVHYVNAKVVLVGESGVGKSGLAIRIAESQFRPTVSTHGAQFWQISIPEDVIKQVSNLPNVKAEMTLWDLAGQPDYHLVHQLFLDDSDVALLLFDCSDPTNPFRGVHYWAKVLKTQLPIHTLKYLVSSRCDVSPVTVDQHQIDEILSFYRLQGYFRTSARTSDGINELMLDVMKKIPWNQLPRTTTPRLFEDVRKFLLQRKSEEIKLIDMDMIKQEAHRLYEFWEATPAEVETVVDLLQSRGLVYLLDDLSGRKIVLLKPEMINQYASSIIQSARSHPQGIGAVSERDVLVAKLPFSGVERLELAEEIIVLESIVELFIQHNLCFRQMGWLVFPSQINVIRPVFAAETPPIEVTYRFSGSVESIYASLVVRLTYTDYFDHQGQWKYAAEFSRNGSYLGFMMRQVEEGTGELEIYFHNGINEFDRVLFIRFITDHLRTNGIDIEERIRLYCSTCGREIENQEAIETRIQSGELDIPCQYCGTDVLIPRSIEEHYQSDKSYDSKQRELVLRVEKRKEKEIESFRRDQQHYTKEEKISLIHILHLSDLRFDGTSDLQNSRRQLESDLRYELGIVQLEYLIVSGDIAKHSTREEYEIGFAFFDTLVKRFGLNASRVVIAPGNHDLNWDFAASSYSYVPKYRIPESLSDEHYIPAGPAGALQRDEQSYRQRFINFNNHFYRKVHSGQEYPLDYDKQAILNFQYEDRLLFLTLNSAWEIDHHYTDRASINMDALTQALDQLQDGDYDDWLKIAVWHHPVTGPNAMNDDFLQLLAVHGFQVCLHGHVHEASQGFYKYDDARGLHIIGAGTFGAPAEGQKPGIPLQYNLLILDPETQTLTVETRKKEKPDGAWMADARWGDKNNPKPRYTIQLKGWKPNL